MKTEDIDGHRPSKWVPMTDPRGLAALGKLQEELGELMSIVARCIIQGGLHERDPETGTFNHIALQEELADVLALTSLVESYFKLDGMAIGARANKKNHMKQEWLDMLRDDPVPESARSMIMQTAHAATIMERYVQYARSIGCSFTDGDDMIYCTNTQWAMLMTWWRQENDIPPRAKIGHRPRSKPEE